MNIIDIIKEQKSKTKYRNNKEEARDYFKKQKDSIISINKTSWFKEIVEYREREVITAQDRLRTMKGDDIKKVQWELNIWIRFLEFIENILNTDMKDL